MPANRRGRSTAAPQLPESLNLSLEDIALAIDLMGGPVGLAKFARRTPENQRFFWNVLMPKVLMLLIESEPGAAEGFAFLAAKWLPAK